MNSRHPSIASSSGAPPSPSPMTVTLADLSSHLYPMENLGDAGVDTAFTFSIDPSLIADRRAVKLGRFLGGGAHSVVYEGLYGVRQVAVKIIQPYKASEVDAIRKKNFQREVVLLSSTRHRNIVKFRGATYDPTLIVITELMRGSSLQKHLWSLRPEGRLDLKLALSFALEISRAMEYLHARGIVHRDLKPGNILLNEEKNRVKLADFGLSREISGDMTCEAGTYRWMAPEMFNMEPTQSRTKQYDHKVDVYSFSLVLWELLTNKTPFEGRNNIMVAYASAKSVRPGTEDVPTVLVPLLESCWSVDPHSHPEFTDVTEYLQIYYHSLYPPEVIRGRQPATSRVFDVENRGDGFDESNEMANSDNNVDNEEEAAPAEAGEEPRGEAPLEDKKKKKKSMFVKCFTCSSFTD